MKHVFTTFKKLKKFPYEWYAIITSIDSLFKEGLTRIGSDQANIPQDIVLCGLHIKSEHCVFENKDNRVTLVPLNGALIYVNGREVSLQLAKFSKQ